MAPRGPKPIIQDESWPMLFACYKRLEELRLVASRKAPTLEQFKQLIKLADFNVTERECENFIDKRKNYEQNKYPTLRDNSQFMQQMNEYYSKLEIIQRVDQGESVVLKKVVTGETTSLVLYQQPRAPYVDLLNQRYVASDANYVWCSDETERDGIYVTIIMDLASRRVLNYRILPEKIISSELNQLISETVNKYGKCNIFHSDAGGVYVSQETCDHLNSLEICRSTAGCFVPKSTSLEEDAQQVPETYERASAFANQVMENFNRRMWYVLGCWRTQKNTLKSWKSFDFEVKKFFIEKTINFLNSDLRKGMVSKNMLYDILKQHPAEYKMLARSDAPLAKVIQDYHIHLVTQWLNYYSEQQALKAQAQFAQIEVLPPDDVELTPKDKMFITTMQQVYQQSMSQTLKTVVAAVNDQVKTIIERTEELAQEQIEVTEATNLMLKEEIKNSKSEFAKIQSELDHLRKLADAEEARRAEAERIKKERAAAKAARVKQPVREPFPLEHFKIGIESITGRTRKVQVRDRIALATMFFTGLRFGNLKNVTFGMLKSYLHERKSFTLEIVKSQDSKKQQTFYYSGGMAPYLKCIKQEIQEFVLDGKHSYDELAFPLERSSFNTRINGFLNIASQKVGKNYKSHSFRIGVVTRVGSTSGLVAAQMIAAHDNIRSTLPYFRFKMNRLLFRTVMDKSFGYEGRGEAGRKKRNVPGLTADPTFEPMVETPIKRRYTRPPKSYIIVRTKYKRKVNLATNEPILHKPKLKSQREIVAGSEQVGNITYAPFDDEA